MGQPTYEDRVRALEEELDIPTSDAQAIIDAEDYLVRQRNIRLRDQANAGDGDGLQSQHVR